jgi:hypothetical protein
MVFFCVSAVQSGFSNGGNRIAFEHRTINAAIFSICFLTNPCFYGIFPSRNEEIPYSHAQDDASQLHAYEPRLAAYWLGAVCYAAWAGGRSRLIIVSIQ